MKDIENVILCVIVDNFVDDITMEIPPLENELSPTVFFYIRSLEL